MSLTIAGDQFVKKDVAKTYAVSGIPDGFVYNSIELPNGWVLADSPGSIVAGNQNIYLTTGIGSGTIIITYWDGVVFQSVYLDVFCSSAKKGEEAKQSGALLIPSSLVQVPSICEMVRCPYTLEVYADIANPDIEANNDKSDFYFPGNSGISSISLTLEKLINGVWTTSVIIINSTYGDFFAFGKHPDFSGNPFIDDFGNRYTGVFLNWLTVLTNKGYGMYRMKIIYTDIFTNVTTLYSQSQYNLRPWSCDITDGTIRIDSLNQGLRGTLTDNTAQIDYSTGWNSQIRLRGIFLYTGSSYNKEFNQYGDSQYNINKPIIHEQIPKYSLTKLYVPAWIVWYLSTNVNQADEIRITDYNSANRFALIKTPVISEGDINIDPNNLMDSSQNILVMIDLNFVYAQNNLRKRNS